MPTVTDAKIKPLQDQINSVQKDISVLNTEIATATQSATYAYNNHKKHYDLKQGHIAMVDQTKLYYNAAYAIRNKLLAKNRKVCGSFDYKGVCEEYAYWAGEVSKWMNKSNASNAESKKYYAQQQALLKIISNLEDQKALLDGEIADLQLQIDTIIANDLKAALADPEVIKKGIEAEQADKDRKAKSQERNLIILVVAVIVLTLGFFAIKQ